MIDNGPDPQILHSTLYPRTLDDLAANSFIEHDICLYNFLLNYNQAQQHQPDWLTQVHQRGIDYSSIRPLVVEVDLTQRGWLQVLDLESSLELFKICYSFWATSSAFERAVLSLQFDESLGVYISRVIQDSRLNHLIPNRHPLVPNSPFQAARDLLMHGLFFEYLHRHLELIASAENRQPTQIKESNYSIP